MEETTNIPTFMNSADKASVPSFMEKEKVTVKVKHINKNMKNKKMKIFRNALIGVTAVIMLDAAYTVKNDTTTVAHTGDTVSASGEVNHWHELTNEDFVRDFMYENPGAKEEDVIEAVNNGELQNYMNNDGEIKRHPEYTIFQNVTYNNLDRYNNEVVPQVDEMLENEEIKSSLSR